MRNAALQRLPENQLDSEAAVTAHIQKRGLADDLIWQLEPIRKARFALSVSEPRPNSGSWNEKQSRPVVYSLRLKDGYLAQELYFVAGESNFADLAAQHGEGSEKGTRGIVGPVAWIAPTQFWWTSYGAAR